MRTTGLHLTDAERTSLLAVAEASVRGVLERGVVELPEVADHGGVLVQPAASFVTLERDEVLLGCIGTLEARRPLVVDVAHNAVAAAFADPRLPAVDHEDFAVMSMKISVLTTPHAIAVDSFAAVVEAITPGASGVLLEAGRHRSTLLPSVWRNVRDASEFASILWCKAGLPVGAWLPETRVSEYRTQEFGGRGPRRPIGRAR